MGNKLDATRIALSQGFTGVSDPTAILDSITKGMESVATWKKGIDDADIKLKTDTAQKYRDAEKKVYDDLPTNETYKAQVLKGLDSYKNRLYNNMKMVQKGVINPNDNLIFQENGKQSFNILAERINNYSKDREAYVKSVSGYTDEKGNFIKPTTGKGGAALEDLNSQMGNPEFTKISFGQDGMARITFYETKINEATSTREIVKDKDGNPIPLKGLENVSVLAYEGQRNQGAGLPRVYLQDQAKEVTGEGSAFKNKYQKMVDSGGFVGNIVDDAKGKSKKEFKTLLTNASNLMSTTAGQALSILSDNGPVEEQSTPLNARQWDEMSKSIGKDAMKDTISYDYYDFDSQEIKQGEKSKYIEMTFSKNNTNVPVLTPEDKLAAERIAQFAIYSQLSREVKRGIEDPQNQRDFKADENEKDRNLRRELANTENKRKDSDKIGTSTLIDDVIQGSSASFQALLRQKNYKSKKIGENKIQIFSDDGTKIGVPLDFTGKGLDVALQLAAEFGLSPEDYKKYNKLKDPSATSKTEGFVDFGGATDVKLSLETKVEGRGSKAVTLSDRIKQVIETADEAGNPQGFFGVDEALLVQGIEGALNEALNKSNQKFDDLKVTDDGDNNITITGKNSKGKTITITGSQESDDKDGMKLEIDAILNKFFQKIDSDEDYTSGVGVNYTDK